MLLPSSLCWEEGQSIPVEMRSLYDYSLGGPSKLQATVKNVRSSHEGMRTRLTQNVICNFSFLSRHRTSCKSTGQRSHLYSTSRKRAERSSCKKRQLHGLPVSCPSGFLLQHFAQVRSGRWRRRPVRGTLWPVMTQRPLSPGTSAKAIAGA